MFYSLILIIFLESYHCNALRHNTMKHETLKKFLKHKTSNARSFQSTKHLRHFLSEPIKPVTQNPTECRKKCHSWRLICIPREFSGRNQISNNDISVTTPLPNQQKSVSLLDLVKVKLNIYFFNFNSALTSKTSRTLL